MDKTVLPFRERLAVELAQWRGHGQREKTYDEADKIISMVALELGGGFQSKDAASEPLCEHPVTVTSETPNGICGKPHAYQWHTDSPVGNVLSAWDHPFMPPPKHAEQANDALAIWWISDEDRHTMPLFHLPHYLYDEICESRGRAGRGRLWIADRFDKTLSVTDAFDQGDEVTYRLGSAGFVVAMSDVEDYDIETLAYDVGVLTDLNCRLLEKAHA